MSLRSQPVTPGLESRPSRESRNNRKRLSFLTMLASPRRNTISGPTVSLATAAAMSSCVSDSDNTTSFLFRQSTSPRSNRNRRNAAPQTSANVMEWLETACPQDLLPKILAFLGPQMTAVFGRTNRFWHDLVSQECTWRSLSEELYKWKPGDDIPSSWRDYYRFNPCVPVDYPSVHRALAVASTPRIEQARSIRILLRPGKYILREAINIQASPNVRVEIETMDLPDCFHPCNPPTIEEVDPPKKSHSLRQLLCRTADAVDSDAEDLPESSYGFDPVSPLLPAPSRASLILRTRRHNEPLLRVRQGFCALRNVELHHVSHGIDIWNGNAAVQIQPPFGPDEQPMLVIPTPEAQLENVEITSCSGRGIVNIDGGHVTIRSCYVHNCAATGIYVGGPGSRAIIASSDVVRNGNGNNQHRRGIARGHSGIYLEQGHAKILDCNISYNSLTGVSAVSPENAFLDMEDSDLVSNGTYQLEMPALGTISRRESSTQNNNLASTGFARARSGLVVDE